MNNPSNIDVDPGIPTNAVSIVDDAADDFPVLKAFQQYIDAEQNKARKRMLTLCIFFGCLMTVVIIIFLVLLNGVNSRNQALNDRLIEYVMKDRDRQSSAVVVQPSASDHSTVFLTAKIDEMQKKLDEAQQKADAIEKARQEEAAKAATEAAIEAARAKAKIKEEIEVARLKAELAAEREKASAERERRRQEEIEAYRRKYYPECYEKKKKLTQEEKIDLEIDEILDDSNDNSIEDYNENAISYFDEGEEVKKPLPQKKVKNTKDKSPSKPTSYSIPVEVKGNRSNWLIPTE